VTGARIVDPDLADDEAFQYAQAVRVAAELGVADRLREGPRTSAELPAVCGAHPRRSTDCCGRWLRG
jgi:hypothetical protein